MKIILLTLFTLPAILATGCNTLSGRIRRNREVFDTYPADVQQAIRAGQVRVGFSRKQVEIALGLPDRVYKRTTAERTTQVWAYVDDGPRFSIGIGLGTGHYHGRGGIYHGFSTILVDDDRYGRHERFRVEFDGNTVIATEEGRRR